MNILITICARGGSKGIKDKNIRDFLDIKIYLDVSPTSMLKRRAGRFGEISEYDKKVAIPEFLKYGITQKRFADYIINANQQQQKVVKEIKKIINSAFCSI